MGPESQNFSNDAIRVLDRMFWGNAKLGHYCGNYGEQEVMWGHAANKVVGEILCSLCLLALFFQAWLWDVEISDQQMCHGKRGDDKKNTQGQMC